MNWKDRISVDPNICHGKVCIKGTRIMVWQVFDHLALGEPLESFPKHFPGRVSLAAAREALQLGKQWFARNGDTWERAVAGLE